MRLKTQALILLFCGLSWLFVLVVFSASTVFSQDMAAERDAARDGSEPLDEVDWTFVDVPAGSFAMGCSSSDPSCEAAEYPRRTVSIQAFAMMQTEVTQAAFERVMGSNPSGFADCGDTCPVESVTYDEALAFCRAIGGRLPSESEWEYAARAGSTTMYSCGDTLACLDSAAWTKHNAHQTTHPVGLREPNAFGLFDMLGNVWEWTADPWHADYRGAPTDGRVWDSGADDRFRVARGGGWGYYSGRRIRNVSARTAYYPSTRFWDTGFRCALDVDP